jgi:Na+-transporting NADH:ubiquinone oxidoreductase subunit C
MDKQGNLYTFLYASVLVVVVAAVLAFLSQSLKPMQQKNAEVAKKIDILKSANIGSTAADAEALYEEHIINTFVLDAQGNKTEADAFGIDLAKELKKKDASTRLYPVYECKLKEGSVKFIIPLRGTGLWGPIWGYISLNEDKNTVFGATFGHKGETPGLGAEIEKENFQKHFIGKTIFENERLVSIEVVKAGLSEGDPHAVDGISGGTITSQGVDAMLKDCLSGYENFLKN